MKARGGIGFVAVVWVFLASVGAYAQNSYQILAEGYPACETKSILKQLRGHLDRGDKAGYSNMLAGENMRGGCTMLKKGEQVFVTGTEVEASLVKLRRRGETRQYWTDLRAVQAKPR